VTTTRLGRGWLALLAAAAALAAPMGCDGHPEPTGPTFYLSVTVGEGIDGHPAAGVYPAHFGPPPAPATLPSNYGYMLRFGWEDLEVRLDGELVPSSGTFDLDRDRTLAATARQRVLWQRYTDGAIYYSTPAIGDDGTLYFGTGMRAGPEGGWLYAVGPDGAVRWRQPLEGHGFTPALGADGTIYLQDSTDAAHAFASDGTPRWTYRDYGAHVARDVGQRSPALGADGTVYVPADGLYALDPASGARRWHVAHPRWPDRECMASPSIGPDGAIYVLIGEDRLFAIEPSGSTRWTLALDHEDEMSFSAPAVGADGAVYFGVEQNPNSFVYAVNADGTRRWKVSVPGGGFVRASPAIGADGTVYVATRSGVGGARLVALAPDDGVVRWDFVVAQVHVTPDDVYSTPSVGADGLVYFGAETGWIYAVRPDGLLDWSYDLKCGIDWSSPTIADDGTIYIGGIGRGFAEGALSAVRSSSPGYAASPWPRFRHDNRNTGRSGGP
jgi:outer membrane protein assembly factor BamB